MVVIQAYEKVYFICLISQESPSERLGRIHGEKYIQFGEQCCLLISVRPQALLTYLISSLPFPHLWWRWACVHLITPIWRNTANWWSPVRLILKCIMILWYMLFLFWRWELCQLQDRVIVAGQKLSNVYMSGPWNNCQSEMQTSPVLTRCWSWDMNLTGQALWCRHPGITKLKMERLPGKASLRPIWKLPQAWHSTSIKKVWPQWVSETSLLCQSP